ncbi:MAG: MFS transporter [Candidatus Omnitrophica bacterium]|nr:MFS transporter [Candidatus Omnitrophota bacterium]
MINLLFLKKNRNLMRFWVAQVFSQFGDRIHQLALIGLITTRVPGSTVAMTTLISFCIIPAFLFQPVAGVIVDRVDRRKLMILCDFARAMLVLMIPAFMKAPGLLPIYLVVFCIYSFTRFYVPAKLALVPQIVEHEQVLEANSLLSTTGMIAAGLGGALGAVFVEFYGSQVGFILDAVTYATSGLLLLAMINKAPGMTGKPQGQKPPLNVKNILADIKEGAQYIRTHQDLRQVVNVVVTLLACVGAVYVVLIVFIQQVFQSVTIDLGFLVVSFAVGLFLGVLLYSKWGKHIKAFQAIFFCLMLGGLMLVIFTLVIQLYASRPLAMGLAFFWGVTIAPIFIAINTIVHKFSDETMHGKTFSALEIIIHATFLLAMFITAGLSKILSEYLILLTVGVIITLVGALGLLKGKKASDLAI